MTPALRVAVRRAVHPALTIDATLTIDRELAVLFGPSGAGKTTLLRLIAGLETPDAGLIEVGGCPFFAADRRINLRLRERRVGYIFQHDVLFPHLDVAGNLRYGLKGQAAATIAARVAAVAELCGIGSLLRRRVGTLSGGERQRVGLARAIAPRPRVLLCDEPVSALDLDARHRLLGRLREIQRAESIPVLLVTHAVDEALGFGDRLFLLDAGRVVAEGPPDRILRDLTTERSAGASPFRNVFAGTVVGHDRGERSVAVGLAEGPTLVVAAVDQPLGTRVFVRVDPDEIVLARGPVGDLSARNILAGTIERIAITPDAAEVAVRIQETTWIVGVIEPTVRALGLEVGVAVQLIIKARSCRLLPGPGLIGGPFKGD